VNGLGERGLLGLAFDPDFDSNHFVYVFYTQLSLRNIVMRLTEVDGVLDPNTQFPVFEMESLVNFNHNGGSLAFGEDGYLYIGNGDGGSSSQDLRANSQDLSNLFGKILRIEKDGSLIANNTNLGTTGQNQAIFHLGLRNPFYINFENSKLVIHDVGNFQFEEINVASTTPGNNFGWPVNEGQGSCSSPPYQCPFFDYPHSGACAITGGMLYNQEGKRKKKKNLHFSCLLLGSIWPAQYLNMHYYMDYCGGYIRGVSLENVSNTVDLATGFSLPVSMTDLADGNMYVLTRSSLSRISYAPPSVCRSADLTGDGKVNLFDVLLVIDSWGPCEGCAADVFCDNVVNLFDVLSVIDAWSN
jgi:hypothetical protein